MHQRQRQVSPTFAEEVREALAAGRPVVALESTILAHGLPPPRNLEIGREMEAAVRSRGAVPATIALLDGHACIGLSQAQLQRICGEPTAKAGVRDLAAYLASGGPAATTVGATIRLASAVGVPVTATGGIGGVHRDSRTTGDVSSDLRELSRAGVAVVCSGAKSILDLPLTLEFLETEGVPVIGFRTSEFPGFYSRGSGLTLEHSVTEVDQLARIIRTQRDLGPEGVLIVQTVPPDREIPWEEVQAMVKEAERQATAQGVAGKALTPFLLAKLGELSGGRTLDANRSLALNNCRLAGELACALRALPSK